MAEISGRKSVVLGHGTVPTRPPRPAQGGSPIRPGLAVRFRAAASLIKDLLRLAQLSK